MDRSSAREAPPLRQPRESVHSGAAWPPATGATAALQTNRWSASTARPAPEGVVAPVGKREPGIARWVGAVDATRKACRQTPTSITVNVSAPSSRCRGPSAVAPGAWRAWPTGGRRDAKPSFLSLFPAPWRAPARHRRPLARPLAVSAGRSAWGEFACPRSGHVAACAATANAGGVPGGEAAAGGVRAGAQPKTATERRGAGRRGAGMARAVAGGAACDDRRRSYTLRTHDAERLAAAPTVPPGGAIGVVASPPTARRGKSTAAGAP